MHMSTINQLSELNLLLSQDHVHHQLSVPHLVEKILYRNEGTLTEKGAVQATTGTYTGRSPKDKFIVRDDVTEDKVEWGP